MKMDYQILFLLFNIFIMTKSDIIYSSCINGTRNITFENGTHINFPCISCSPGNYTKYSEEDNELYCEKCPLGSSSYGSNILISNFTEQTLSRYSYSFSNISNSNIIKPIWKLSTLSVKMEYIDSLSYAIRFNINVYFMNNGSMTIKYINFNGDINKVFNIYKNDRLIYQDDTTNSIMKAKTFDVKEGNNYFTFEYSVNDNLKPKSLNYNHVSFLEIFEILLQNAETSSIDCEKYENLESLKNNLHNYCEYDISKCSFTKDYCTHRFYHEIKNNYCFYNTNTRSISYSKLGESSCQELITPIPSDETCSHCSYGQYLYEEQEQNKKYCKYCENNNYNSKKINDLSDCEETCDKYMEKILIIDEFEDSSKYENKKINIVEGIGYIIIYYVRFNEKVDCKIFIELDDNDSSLKLVNPNDYIENLDNNNYYSINLPLNKGKHSIKIKGGNLYLKKIIIKGSDEGGYYNCVDKLNYENEKICEKNNEHYSIIQENCTTCPIGTKIDLNKYCNYVNKIINNKYILDNELLNLKIFAQTYSIGDETKYYININPNYPLIYYKNENNMNIIGKELYNIKLVKGNKYRGIILSFIYIEKENEKKITTFSHFYLSCDLSDSTKEEFEYISKIDSEEDTHYFFKIYTNSSCPYCLTSEVKMKYNESEYKCINKTKTVDLEIKENSLCIIKSYNANDESKISDTNEILLKFNSEKREDKLLIEQFKIDEDIPINYETEDDDIVTSYKKILKCKEEIVISNGMIVLIIVAIALGLCLIGVIIWKIIVAMKKKGKNNINSEDDRNESLTELINNKPDSKMEKYEKIIPESIL